MSMRLHRRRFLHASAAGTLGYFFTASSASAGRAFGANEKLSFAGIGVGGKGSSDISHAALLGDVIAICDCDEVKKHLGWAAEKWPQAKKFTDYRKLFDDKEIMKAVDAFTISTPDHNHALPAVLAMRAGKHVYVQKPLTRTVFEAHLLMKVAKETKVCSQMGNQGTAANGLRKAVELVRAGEIGAVKEVHVWTNRPIWPQAPKVMKRPDKEDPVPPTLNWDAFIGPAPMRPHVGNRTYHDFAWRGWWDFGTGAIGDMACHTANMAFMALKLGSPEHVSAEAGDVNPETCPSYAHVTLKFPARGEMPPVTLHWYEGKKDGKKLVPPDDLVQKAIALDTNAKRKGQLVNSGSILVGEKGIAYSPDDYGSEVFFGTGTVANNKSALEKFPVNNGGDSGQKKEWVDAIKAGKPELALSNFDYASMLTAAFLLGNVAIRSGKGFAFDGSTLKADSPEAAKYLHYEYRKGWDLLGEKA